MSDVGLDIDMNRSEFFSSVREIKAQMISQDRESVCTRREKKESTVAIGRERTWKRKAQVKGFREQVLGRQDSNVQS